MNFDDLPDNVDVLFWCLPVFGLVLGCVLFVAFMPMGCGSPPSPTTSMHLAKFFLYHEKF